MVFNILKEEEEGQVLISTLSTSDKAYRSSMNLSHGRFRLDIKRWFFIKRVVGHWGRLPRQVVTAPRLIELKKCLDTTLGYVL